VIVLICYRGAKDGIVTGILLAVARVAGETAPLLFTSLGNLNWSVSLTAPMASLPVTIYQYAGSAFDDWVQPAAHRPSSAAAMPRNARRACARCRSPLTTVTHPCGPARRLARRRLPDFSVAPNPRRVQRVASRFSHTVAIRR